LTEFLAKTEKLSDNLCMAEIKPSDWLSMAIDHVGSLSAFAEAVNAPSRQAVQQWKVTQVPAAYCPDIERITGVRCEKLRPDVNWGVLRRKGRAAA
jgi:DNA-binding transcriptional regulator YdaS (Cro superfamily)